MCNGIDKPQAIVDKARAKGLCLSVDMYLRFTPEALLSKRCQNESQLGYLLFINMSLWIMNPNESSSRFHINTRHLHTFNILRYFCGNIEINHCIPTKAPG